MMWYARFPIVLRRFLSLLLLFVSNAAHSRVLINEVYYDHPGRDEGWEFVELCNAGEVDCDLCGYRIEFVDGLSLRSRDVWIAGTGLVLAPGEHLLVSGAARLPEDELLLLGTLENGPDALRLVAPAGVVDLIGYGELGQSGLYESSPAPDAGPGFSLARKPDGRDTDSNGADFVVAEPSPGTRNFFSTDLGVSITYKKGLPCRGEGLPIGVTIENYGLDPCSGSVLVETSVIVEGNPVASKTTETTVALGASCSDFSEVLLLPPYLSRFEILAAIRYAPDENEANDTAEIHLNTSPGPVVVNEIMYRPRTGGSEWVELKNSGASPCNICNWSLSDARNLPRLVSAEDLWIDAKGFLILAQNPAAFVRDQPCCGAEVAAVRGGWPVLNDGGDAGIADVVELYDETGVLEERVEYENLVGDERGRTIERFSALVCSSIAGGVWHMCASAEGSTPGAENSIGGEPGPPGLLEVSPNPFCPRRDGYVSFSCSLGEGETGLLVRIFDMGGLEVRRLFGEAGGARFFSCRWDGRHAGGSIVRTGLYICVYEFVGSGGAVCRTEKRCVAVAGGL